ncbi:MAG: R3H domain-containing nucleic acid-binding protein [Acidobacteriota bacterium]
MSDETVIENLTDFVNRVIELSGLELTAQIERHTDAYIVEIAGEDVPLLLGRNGELLNALEYLAHKTCGRQLPAETRIVFDSEGFRNVRARELQLMAIHAAERVRVSRRPFVFEPMSPGERRIIHLALAEDASVRTESQGEGDDRKVTIHPNK